MNGSNINRRTKDFLINVHCDFCLTLQYERWLIEDRRDKYNRKAHVKRAVMRQGVIINNYVNDNHERVIEKQTRTFSKIRFCPICGFDYIEGRPYDGRKYKIDINSKSGGNSESTS